MHSFFLFFTPFFDPHYFSAPNYSPLSTSTSLCVCEFVTARFLTLSESFHGLQLVKRFYLSPHPLFCQTPAPLIFCLRMWSITPAPPPHPSLCRWISLRDDKCSTKVDNSLPSVLTQEFRLQYTQRGIHMETRHWCMDWRVLVLLAYVNPSN